jgi:hypothetical protein
MCSHASHTLLSSALSQVTMAIAHFVPCVTPKVPCAPLPVHTVITSDCDRFQFYRKQIKTLWIMKMDSWTRTTYQPEIVVSCSQRTIFKIWMTVDCGLIQLAETGRCFDHMRARGLFPKTRLHLLPRRRKCSVHCSGSSFHWCYSNFWLSSYVSTAKSFERPNSVHNSPRWHKFLLASGKSEI